MGASSFRLDRTSDANDVSERIVDDHGIIALIKARGNQVNAGPLLAAAPEMLAVLKMLSGMDLYYDVLGAVDAVIAKAEERL